MQYKNNIEIFVLIRTIGDRKLLPILSEIGKRRKALDLTQHGLAKEAGVSRSLIAKIERGHANPSYGEARKIFETLERLESRIPLQVSEKTLDKVHNPDILWAEVDEPLYDAQKRMVEKYYSQLPVRKKGKIVGSLTERGINRTLVEKRGMDQKTLLVEDAMDDAFPIVPTTATVSSVIPLLQVYQGVLTAKDGDVVGIVTNADILKSFR